MSPNEQMNWTEIDIATLVWQGRTNPEIARLLSTSEQVIKNHLRSIFDKLGVFSRLELAIFALNHGLIHDVEDGRRVIADLRLRAPTRLTRERRELAQ